MAFNKRNKDNKIDEGEENKDNKIENVQEYSNIDFNDLKTFIFEEFSKNVNETNNQDNIYNHIDNLIKLIDCLEGKNEKGNVDNQNMNKEENEKNINEFFEKLMKNNLFEKDDFFSSKQDYRIILLCELYEKDKIKNNQQEYYDNIINLLTKVRNDIEGEIKKSKLEEFLKIEESLVIKRLNLIKLVLPGFNPKDKYEELNNKNEEINKEIEKLKYIKDNIIIYHKEFYQVIIKRLIDIIKNNQNKKLSDYKAGSIRELIQEIEKPNDEKGNLKDLADKVNKVKNFLLFNIIYEMNSGKDENKKFDNAYEELEKIGELLNQKVKVVELNEQYKDTFKKIKEKLSNNEERSKKFIKYLIDYYVIKDETLIDELTILFKSKKYEMDIKSIIFFFEFFQKDNVEWNDKFKIIQKSWEEDFKTIKNGLNNLKEKEIYDYTNIKNYNKLFTCLYDKKEAIDYLISKKKSEILKLKDKIQPTDRTISIQDVLDTEKCVDIISQMKDLKDNFKIFEYIKKLRDKEILQFDNYSRIYSSIIELDSNDDFEENVFDKVNNIIKDATFNILQDEENFLYYNEKKEKNENITMEELVHIKNQIHIKSGENNEDDIIKSKCKILTFFKNAISNLEVINGYMIVLRTKGSSLPIRISIKINIQDKEPNIKYYLGEDKKDFKEIRDFLFKVKNKYINQLNLKYKEKLNIRFLYGKQFRSIMKHLESNFKIDSFLRYILNNTDNNISINEGFKVIKRNTHDYINQYELYNENSLDSISSYITTLFTSNDNRTLEDHYDRMKTIFNHKGIHLVACETYSMEEHIINLFWDEIGQLPIAQNVLITNKETSSEEIQSFFHRAILCNYNTLFVVEINNSFSEYQQSMMNSYIDNLLTYKNKKYNEEIKEKEKDNVDREKTDIYLDSSIVFIYDKENINIIQLIKELSKFESKKDEKRGSGVNDALLNNVMTLNKNKDYSSKLDNIFVISSEICGLGKSGKIKKIIEDKKEIYFHFPLGGILNKNIIFDKLENLLNGENGINEKLKSGNKTYKDISIHLDLTESKETSILNEFFFAFLITKFYTNNENIIYIPKDINIYIEIPNCFEDYLSKFSILNIFKTENITIENMPPFNFSQEIINIFDRMLGIKSNEEMQNFVKKYIGVERYSYHQINIFIKLFISQYSKFESKLRFLQNYRNVTQKCIEKFAKCTQYFINGGFSQLLTEKKDDKKYYIDKLSEVYENDLNNMKFQTPLLFIIKEKMEYDELYFPTKESTNYKCSKDYLTRMKEILNLPFEVDSLLSIIEEKNNNYVITNDNFKKMVLLVYRIIANVPVIIMGDTGCGKTSLITKLNQILNNGEKTLEIVNIHPGITDDKLCQIMEKVDQKAKNMKDKELWLFFDEINTCLSLSLLTEIYINRTYNGKRFSDNIRLIGACNPYRKRKGNKEKCGLSRSNDNENELVYLVQPLPQSLLYYVFSFGSIDEENEKKYIHSIIEKLFTKEEKVLHEITRDVISESHKYLRNIYDPSVVSLREIARFAKCIEFFNDYFTKKNNYYIVKNIIEKRINNIKNNKLRSIICSIYLCYYTRLTDQNIRFNFEAILRPVLLKLINNDINYIAKGGDLMKEIKNKELTDEISTRPEEIINKFSDFLRIEQDYLLNQIELDKGIGKNTLLKENIFLLFLSVVTNIPLIIIGKPGTGKSLSAQLINKSMRGKYSKNKFFQQYPQIIQTYFQGSESTQPEDVERLFRTAENKMESYKKRYKKEKLPIIMTLFDELGLAERSESNPLKVLHHKLEYTGKEEGISFVGLSNYSLDAAKVNRALVLSVPDLDQKLDDLIETSLNIVENISEKLKNEPIFKIISNTYFRYKEQLQIIKELVVYKQYVSIKKQINSSSIKPKINHNLQNKEALINQENISYVSPTDKSDKLDNKDESNKKVEIEKRQFDIIKDLKEFKDLLIKDEKIRKDFHGNRDFYNLIKGIAFDLGRLGDTNDEEKVPIIIKYIERNFGGIEYEIDIDFNLILDDIREKIVAIRNILDDYDCPEKNDKNKHKINSVYIFKKLYNSILLKDDPNSKLIIDNLKINEYNLNNCINDNIRDINSRYLLLEIKPSLTSLIYQNIKLQNPFKNIVLYEGSPFVDDNNKEYRFKIINKIQDDAKEDTLIIIENLNQIHPFLFDLYNMNYIMKDEKKFVRICLENFNEQLTLVDNNFRIIIFVDKKFVNQCELALLNRFEKIILSFDKLLDNNLKRISNNFMNELKLRELLKKYRNINFSIRDLLINCGEQEIQGLIYYYSKEARKNNSDDNEEQQENNVIDEKALKENVINKIYKILPQDIICILQDNNIIYEKYISNTIFYNYKDYINEENKKFKISIIYTYTSITNKVEGLNIEMSFMINEIKSEDGLKERIEEIKNGNENNKMKKEYNICIKFERANSNKIKFISNYILNNFYTDNYNYIFIIHINRSFIDNNNKFSYRKIYSLPDINPSINQLFIDNLNANNSLNLKYLLMNGIKTILEEKKDELKLNEEFNKTLINTISKELNKIGGFENNLINGYINEILDYMKDEERIKDKIIEISYKLIEKDEESNCKEIIDNLYKSNYINKYSIDIASCLIEYIKENKFNKYIKELILILENDNVLTTLLQIRKNEYKDISNNQVEEILNKYLDEIIEEKNKEENNEKNDIYEPKFLFNYNVPGLYNFYMNISNYISKNISWDYFNNEKKLRDAKREDIEKIRDFQDNESDLLGKLNKEISKNKMFNVIITNKIQIDLILKDYITFYLQKYYNVHICYDKNDIYHKLIELLLKLRFNKEHNIIKDNNNNNILSIKLIWIESNVNYIKRILQIFEKCFPIFTDEIQFYTWIDELIFKDNEDKIKYITYEKKNPEFKKEVNECYYLLLASICYCITSDKIILTELNNKKENNEIEISQYNYILKDINKILQNLNDDLHIFLNEMYIIDELIKIIDIFTKKNNNIEKIKEIKNLIRKSGYILQKNSDNPVELIEELSNNFEAIYSLIFKEENIENNDKEFYDKLRYILYKEILKISDINYRSKILEKLLESNEMIKNSNDIFQILLEKYVKKDKYLDNITTILNGEDVLIKIIEKNIHNNFVLAETILYFFEKNSNNYLINYLNTKKEKDKKKYKYLDEEPLKILKQCYELLNSYMFEPKELNKLLKETCKLFCLGYIKPYLYIFIKTFDDKKFKSEDESRKKIIDIINGDNSIYKMMRIYIFKIIYNKFRIDAFTDEKMIEKYKINNYRDFDSMEIKDLNNIYKIDFYKTLKEDYYIDSYKIFEEYRKNEFKDKLKTSDYDIEEYGIDNFYVLSYNISFTNLQMEKSEINKNFYTNICQPLFKDDHLLSEAIKLFYDPAKYSAIKKRFKISSDNIKPLLFSYRYCLNELSSKNTKGIYYPLYDISNINYLKEQYYPGNDTKYNKVYSRIINHFKTKPNEGCYVCLCEKQYYRSVKAGFPNHTHLNMKCPRCKEPIGMVEEGFFNKEKIVKRKGYKRIFRDKNEIEELKKDKEKRDKLNEINYMILDDYKKQYIDKEFEKEKGVFINKDNKNGLEDFRNDQKIVRNLSQISFRILNYILYSHLFFARLLTNKNNEFDKYLPKGTINMTWVETLNECWNLLKNELLKENIDSIEIFMSYIFTELFPLLNKEQKINDYKKLITFEDTLEKEIQTLIRNFKGENIENNLQNKKKEIEKKSSLINLLKEAFTSKEYKKEDFPFYEYFYYTDYLNEEYINEKFSHIDDSKYPVIKQYLLSKTDKNKYSLKNLNLFKSVLNLISEEYTNKLSRNYAEKYKLINEDIYKNNKDLIEKFIKFYNGLEIDNYKLSSDNLLCDFLIVDNKFGDSYKKIYKEFAKEQNKSLENLLDNKIEIGIFDDNCKSKINIQQINETEIFTLLLPKEVSFIEVLFNSSYRKILDSETYSYKSYKEFEIDYDLIEEKMTDLLVKNKKLLNYDITEFNYNNEVFEKKITNLFTIFKESYNQKNIILLDKVVIYKFVQENKNNIIFCKKMINDFITLIELLNVKKKQNNNTQENKSNNDITEETKIYEVINKEKDSFINDNFIKMFEKNDSLTIDKTYEIFEYYLKFIYEDIKKEMKKYQKNLDKESIEQIKNIYLKENIIDKKSFAHAIRFFITFVLFLEEDKEKKIKSNLNNIINYLKAPDLWNKNIYENQDFNANLNKLKIINAHINQIVDLYDKLGKDIEDNFCDDVKKQIEKENEKDVDQNKLIDDEVKKEGDKWGNKVLNEEDKEEIEENPREGQDNEDEEEESEEAGGGKWGKKKNEEDDDSEED